MTDIRRAQRLAKRMRNEISRIGDEHDRRRKQLPQRGKISIFPMARSISNIATNIWRRRFSPRRHKGHSVLRADHDRAANIAADR